MTVKTRPVLPDDRRDWEELYRGYAEFYGVPQTDAMRATTWSWLHDPDHAVHGIVAEDMGRVVGLTHFRPFASPLRAITNCFLDDLYVDLDARGGGAAQALIRAVEAVARDRGWGTVRWITAEDNYRARAVYDRIATRTPWVTYDIKL